MLVLAAGTGCPRVDPGPAPAPAAAGPTQAETPAPAEPPPAAVASHPDTAAPFLAAPIPGRVDFATQIRPLLEARCRPCHFAGGKMYAALPFDRPVTIYLLGTRLFTRIKEPAQRQLITAFLEQKED